jgi:hypothetical protein
LGAGLLLDYGLRQYGIREREARLVYGENEKPIQKRIADKDTRRNKYRYFSLLA